MQLHDILTTRRSHNSVGDFLFRGDLLRHLAPYKPQVLGEGNIVVCIGQSHVAFSCHIDTCHSGTESDGTPQKIVEDMGLLMLNDPTAGCLGADDGLGIYLMLRLIEQGTPGTYFFHVGEECGGIGSSDINRNHREALFGIDLIVAFDRAVKPGQAPEVIVSQGWEECASEACGQALCDQLGMGFEVSHEGVFTDTKLYAANVAECLNVGCFYDLQHGRCEYVDMEKFRLFEQAVLRVDWESLPIVRQPQKRSSLPGFKTSFLSSEEERLLDAFDEAIDGNQRSLRRELVDYAGPTFEFLGEAIFEQEDLDVAYEMALAGDEYGALEYLFNVGVAT